MTLVNKMTYFVCKGRAGPMNCSPRGQGRAALRNGRSLEKGKQRDSRGQPLNQTLPPLPKTGSANSTHCYVLLTLPMSFLLQIFTKDLSCANCLGDARGSMESKINIAISSQSLQPSMKD